jgi:hypothetical protein
LLGIVAIFGIGSVAFSVIGPKILGNATTSSSTASSVSHYPPA